MTILVLCNVGNRDVRFENQTLSKPRLGGEAFVKRWDAVIERLRTEKPPSAETIAERRRLEESLSLPIIEPVLHEILGEHKWMDKLVLFVTDQRRTPQSERFWERDTLHFGTIIKRYLRRRPDFRHRIGEIKVQPVSSINPSLYDQAFVAFGPLVSSFYDDEVKVCYAIVVGGTPAFNMGLLFHAVRLFGGRCRTIYKPEAGEAYHLNIGERLQKAMRRETVITHLERGDFAAAHALMEMDEVDYHRALRSLVRYIKHRLYFDFDEAQQALEDGLTHSDDVPFIRDFVLSLRHELDDLKAKKLEALIIELYHNTMLTYKNGRYVDFLGRAFRFREGVARYIVEKVHEIGTDDTKDRQIFLDYIEKNMALRDFLEAPEQYHRGKPLKRCKIATPLLVAMVKYLVEATGGPPDLLPEERGRYGGIHALLARMDRLSELRNKCIGAHGFDGVSREIILRDYGEGGLGLDGVDPPIRDMTQVVERLGFTIPPDPYRHIAKFVIRNLREG